MDLLVPILSALPALNAIGTVVIVAIVARIYGMVRDQGERIARIEGRLNGGDEWTR